MPKAYLAAELGGVVIEDAAVPLDIPVATLRGFGRPKHMERLLDYVVKAAANADLDAFMLHVYDKASELYDLVKRDHKKDYEALGKYGITPANQTPKGLEGRAVGIRQITDVAKRLKSERDAAMTDRDAAVTARDAAVTVLVTRLGISREEAMKIVAAEVADGKKAKAKKPPRKAHDEEPE